MSHAYAVVDGHPVFEVLFFSLLFLVHDLGEFSRRKFGGPPETAIA